MPPIDILPPETLTSIFNHLRPTPQSIFFPFPAVTIPSAKTSPILPSHVCRSWRQVTTNCPSLWSHIIINIDAPHDVTHPSQELTQLFLERSKEFPLQVYITMREGLSGVDDGLDKMRSLVERCLKTVMVHSERFRDVSMSFDTYIGNAPLNLPVPQGNAPLLRGLSLRITDIALAQTIQSHFKIVPKLSSLFFASHVPLLIPINNLSNLNIFYPFTPVSTFGVLGTDQNNPNGPGSTILRSQKANKPVLLPDLKGLSAATYGPIQLPPDYLSVIAAPELTYLTLLHIGRGRNVPDEEFDTEDELVESSPLGVSVLDFLHRSSDAALSLSTSLKSSPPLSNLVELKLRGIGFSPRDIIQVLSILRWIMCLNLADETGVERKLIDWLTLESHLDVVDETESGESQIKNDKRPTKRTGLLIPLPYLRHLALTNFRHTPEARALLRLAQSRKDPNCKAITFDETPKPIPEKGGPNSKVQIEFLDKASFAFKKIESDERKELQEIGVVLEDNLDEK